MSKQRLILSIHKFQGIGTPGGVLKEEGAAVLRRRSRSSLSKSLGFLRSTCCDTRSVDGTGLLGMLLPPPMCAVAGRTAPASAQPHNKALSGSASAVAHHDWMVRKNVNWEAHRGSSSTFLSKYMYQSYTPSPP